MRARTPILLLAGALSVLAGVNSWAALQGRSLGSETASRQGGKPTQQEEPTPIQEGVMTTRQKKHSKVFKGFAHATRGRKIPDLVSELGDVELSGGIDEVPLIPRMPISQSLSVIACKSDAVVIGTVNEKLSHLIESGTFTFTDYELTVQEVLKDNPLAQLQPGAIITVTRAGGTVRLKGHTVRAVSEQMAPLAVGGRYLLYLVFLPETSAYRPLVSPFFDDSFHLDNDRATQVSRKQLPLGRRGATDVASFLTEARNAIHQPCRERGR